MLYLNLIHLGLITHPKDRITTITPSHARLGETTSLYSQRSKWLMDAHYGSLRRLIPKFFSSLPILFYHEPFRLDKGNKTDLLYPPLANQTINKSLRTTKSAIRALDLLTSRTLIISYLYP